MDKENIELRKKFQENLKTAKSFMEPVHKQMDLYYEIYRNRWTDKDYDFKVSDLHAYVETVVPILTNNRVRASIKAEFPEYIKHAEGMGYILDHVFDTNDWDYVAQRIARMAEIYRSGLAYTGYDADANNGTGKLTVYEINPRWCYLDPAVTELEDSSFFFYTEPIRLSKVKKMYPDKAKKLEERKGQNNYGEKNSGGWFRNLFQSISNSLSFVGNDKAVSVGSEFGEEDRFKNSVAFIHYWYRDEEDNWRVSYWADDILLEDSDNPFWHRKLPYDIYSPTEDILSVLGVPMAEHIEYLNNEKNVLMDTIVKHAKKSVKPPRIVNTILGIKDSRDLQGKDNLIHVANPDFIPLNALVADLVPPPLPSFADALPDRFDAMIDKISGVNDSFRGMADATSGKEVQLKQEAAYTRIKTKVDNFEKFTKSIAEKIIINAMQFIDSTRPFRVRGDYKQFENMIDADETPFTVEPIPNGIDQETGEPINDRQEFFLYANPNEWTRIEQIPDGEGEEQAKEANRILQLVVEIEAGSSLPTSRQAMREEALELFSAGLIDQQAVLETFDYPKMEEVMKRMNEQMQMQQQAEMERQLQQMQMKQQTMPNQVPQEQPQQPDMASQLDALRQIAPEIENMSDEEIMQLLAGMNQQQPTMG